MNVSLVEKRKKRFADFADEPQPLAGDKVKLDAILNREIEITGYRVGATRYSKNQSGKFLTIQVSLNGKTNVVFTGSDVLLRQIEKYHKEIPFFTIIRKINRYYVFT